MQVAFWGTPSLLRRSDCDAKMLGLEDPEMRHVQGQIFRKSTSLWAIMAEFNESFSNTESRVKTSIEGLEAWIGNLPETLRLYDLGNQRRNYDRSISELWIQYFVTLILCLTPRYEKLESIREPCQASRVAASAVVTLYDEMHCRDDTSTLLPIHGFFCLASSLPVIFSSATTGNGEPKSREDKLSMLREVLSRLRPRYGDADLAIGKINGLCQKLDRERQLRAHVDYESPTHLPMSSSEARLFPFADDFCEDMHFTRTAENPEGSATFHTDFSYLDNQEELGIDWSLSAMYDMDYGALFSTEDLVS